MSAEDFPTISCPNFTILLATCILCTMASHQPNLVREEEAACLSEAEMLLLADDTGTTSNSEEPFQTSQSRRSKRKNRPSLEGEGNRSSSMTNKRSRDTTSEEPDIAKETGERKRLYFSNSCELTQSQKRLWSAKLAQQYRSYKPSLKEGLNRPYITVEGTEAVVMLTTEGYDGVVMEQPKGTEKLTKVFIAPYDHLLDPELLLDDERVMWAKRHVVRGEKKKSVVALVRGEVPQKLHVLGNGYRKVHKFIEQPIQCYNCSRWNHKAWSCRYEICCKFCGGKHHSSECAKKNKEGETVSLKCCNCGGPHSASSKLCVKRPKVTYEQENKVTYADAPAPTVNAWDRRGGNSTESVVALSSSSHLTDNSPTPNAPPLHAATTDSAILQDILSEMRANFVKLYEKVDAVEKANEAKIKEMEERCENKYEKKINELEKKYEEMARKVSAENSNDDEFEKLYEEKIKEMEMKCEKKYEKKINELETMYEALKQKVGAEVSDKKIDEYEVSVDQRSNKKVDDNEVLTAPQIRKNCQAIENVLHNLINNAGKGKVTKGNLLEALVAAVGDLNS